MRCLLCLAAIGLIAAPALAGSQILPVKGMQYATYNPATGELTPTAGSERIGPSVWASTQPSGFYYVQMFYGPGTTSLDWGDIAGPQDIGGYAIGYATDVVLPERLDVVTMFFAEENGFNSTGRVFLAGFQGVDLPTADPGGGFNGWTVTFDLDAGGVNFTIDGSDLDGDGLADFGYTYWFTNYVPTPLNYTGPIIAGDPNVIPPTSPGIEDAWDEFFDPNLQNYDGAYWFGGFPFAQFYMELFDSEANGCPNPGAHGEFCTADFAGEICLVNLEELAQMLANYPTASGATRDMGDIEPPPAGDGDVDLADLALLLSQYLDDCR